MHQWLFSDVLMLLMLGKTLTKFFKMVSNRPKLWRHFGAEFEAAAPLSSETFHESVRPRPLGVMSAELPIRVRIESMVLVFGLGRNRQNYETAIRQESTGLTRTRCRGDELKDMAILDPRNFKRSLSSRSLSSNLPHPLEKSGFALLLGNLVTIGEN
jgi:hypothetical protein